MFLNSRCLLPDARFVHLSSNDIQQIDRVIDSRRGITFHLFLRLLDLTS
jgi:hypothetical protein